MTAEQGGGLCNPEDLTPTELFRRNKFSCGKKCQGCRGRYFVTTGKPGELVNKATGMRVALGHPNSQHVACAM